MNTNTNESHLERIRKPQQIIEEIEGLPPEQKEEILSALLEEKAPGRFSMILGNGHISKADMVIQVNSLSGELLKSIVDAIASKIEKG